MRYLARYLLPVICLLAASAPVFAEAAPQGASVNQAAAFYHQGKYDSALTRLESLKSQGPWKRRDSLSLFQYLGMASARLGMEGQATGYFRELLGLDSLFQFPRNEDPQVLQAFARARENRTVRAEPPVTADATPSPAPSLPASSSVPAPPVEPADRIQPVSMANSAPAFAKFSMADSGAPGSRPHSAGNVGFAMGALPFGIGWVAHDKTRNGLVLGFLQAGGVALSLYASQMQSKEASDRFGVQNEDERTSINTWKWVQRVSVSTALGAYLFSLIASAGD